MDRTTHIQLARTNKAIALQAIADHALTELGVNPLTETELAYEAIQTMPTEWWAGIARADDINTPSDATIHLVTGLYRNRAARTPNDPFEGL